MIQNIKEQKQTNLQLLRFWENDKVPTKVGVSLSLSHIRYGQYGRNPSWIVKIYGKYGRKASWIVKRYGQYGRKASWIVKRYGNYGRKIFSMSDNYFRKCLIVIHWFKTLF